MVDLIVSTLEGGGTKVETEGGRAASVEGVADVVGRDVLGAALTGEIATVTFAFP